jgi:hypothetical protein
VHTADWAQSAHSHASGKLPNVLQKPSGSPLQGVGAAPPPEVLAADVGLPALSLVQPANPANTRDKEEAKIRTQLRIGRLGSRDSLPESTVQSGKEGGKSRVPMLKRQC